MFVSQIDQTRSFSDGTAYIRSIDLTTSLPFRRIMSFQFLHSRNVYLLPQSIFCKLRKNFSQQESPRKNSVLSRIFKKSKLEVNRFVLIFTRSTLFPHQLNNIYRIIGEIIGKSMTQIESQTNKFVLARYCETS